MTDISKKITLFFGEVTAKVKDGHLSLLCEACGCENSATHFIAGTEHGDIEPRQLCDVHYELLSENRKIDNV